MTVKVQVSKLTDTSKGQYNGGTYWVDDALAKELVAGGNAAIIKTAEGVQKPTTPAEPPFLPTKSRKGDAPKTIKPKEIK